MIANLRKISRKAQLESRKGAETQRKKIKLCALASLRDKAFRKSSKLCV